MQLKRKKLHTNHAPVATIVGRYSPHSYRWATALQACDSVQVHFKKKHHGEAQDDEKGIKKLQAQLLLTSRCEETSSPAAVLSP